jgi:hypothetical protein
MLYILTKFKTPKNGLKQGKTKGGMKVREIEEREKFIKTDLIFYFFIIKVTHLPLLVKFSLTLKKIQF